MKTTHEKVETVVDTGFVFSTPTPWTTPLDDLVRTRHLYVSEGSSYPKTEDEVHLPGSLSRPSTDFSFLPDLLEQTPTKSIV